MANNRTQTIVEAKESETIVEKEIVVTTTKSVKEKVVDMTGGKVQLYVEGYVNGETISVTVDGRKKDVEITDGLGIYCSNYSFMQYPVIQVND